MEISKELLSEVFEQEIRFIKYVANNTYEVHFEKPIRLKYIIINIYELAHKCKEWAWRLGYDLPITRHDNNSFCIKIDEKNVKYHKSHWGDSESIGIFKACQWILDSKEGI